MKIHFHYSEIASFSVILWTEMQILMNLRHLRKMGRFSCGITVEVEERVEKGGVAHQVSGYGN